MIIDSYDKTQAYTEENLREAMKIHSEEFSFFKFLYNQNLEITNWMSSGKKIDSARSAFVLNRLHKAQRFLFTCHTLILSGQCDEANVLMRNIIELLLRAVDIKIHDRGWGKIQASSYSFNTCFDRIKSNDILRRYHKFITEHGKLSGFWSHENFKTDRIESILTTDQDGEQRVRQELSTGYSHKNPLMWIYLADVVKLSREITQTIDFLFGELLQKERKEEWETTKSKFEGFLKKEKVFKEKIGWKD